MRTEKIAAAKKRFPHEWLLISVDKIDVSTTTPISGKVLAHSHFRKHIYRMLLGSLKANRLLIEYSEDNFPGTIGFNFFLNAHI